MGVKKKGRGNTGPNYDKAGRVNINGVKIDVCDCMELNCSGCFYPCYRCGSEKCGTHCRRYRRFMYDEITWDGMDHKIRKNPYLPSKRTE